MKSLGAALLGLWLMLIDLGFAHADPAVLAGYQATTDPASPRPTPDVACLPRLYAASEAVQRDLRPSTALITNDAVYRSPSQGMREAADEMDARDARIAELVAALKACRGER